MSAGSLDVTMGEAKESTKEPKENRANENEGRKGRRKEIRMVRRRTCERINYPRKEGAKLSNERMH